MPASIKAGLLVPVNNAGAPLLLRCSVVGVHLHVLQVIPLILFST
jgi:hypothetical protein